MSKALYFDDVGSDRKRFGSLLSAGKMKVVSLRPPATLDPAEFAEEAADLYLVDYQLSKRDGARRRAGYQGGTLAAAIREYATDSPIIALTRRGLFDQGTFREERLADIFDAVIYKGDVQDEPEKWRTFLVTTADGFRSLRKTGHRTWKSLMGLMDANVDEENSLREAAPPLRRETYWRVRDVARWLRDVVFAFPGILYDAVHAATLLGVDEKSFLESRVQSILRASRYSGILAPVEGRWWRDRLLSQATRIMLKQGVNQPIALGFREAYEAQYGTRLRASRCIFSAKEPAEVVCYIYKQPVRREFSLPYFADNRPSIMDEARVSFKAIRESNKVIDEKFGKDALPLLEKIRRMRAPR